MIEHDWFTNIARSVVEALAAGDPVTLRRTDRHATAALVREILRGSQRRGKLEPANLIDFMLYAGPYAHLSKAQLFQDLWVLWETRLKRKGYFVEFGAMDGVRLSNTWLLENEFEWSGVVAEPNPDFAQALAANRSCYKSTKCVHWHSGEMVPFRIVDKAELSRLGSIDPADRQESSGLRSHYKEVSIPSISLHDLLVEARAPSEIDYLSIDTEGSEYEILRGFDFGRWRIKLISVEHNKTPKRGMIFELLKRAGYMRKWEYFTQYDDWYCLASG